MSKLSELHDKTDTALFLVYRLQIDANIAIIIVIELMDKVKLAM